MFAGRLIVAKSTLLDDVRHDSKHGNGRTSRIMMTMEMIGAGQSRPSFRRSFGKIISAVTRPSFKKSLGARSWNANALRAGSPNLDRTIDLWASTHAFLERVRRPG
jgi:hypothetical protein